MFIKIHKLYLILRKTIKNHMFSASYWVVFFNPAYIAHKSVLQSLSAVSLNNYLLMEVVSG